jgi:hypothetical protein
MIGKRGVRQRVAPHPTGFGGAAAVTTVTNADGSLIISPADGDVIASLNVGNANTWTADQSFNDDVHWDLGTGTDVGIYYDGTDLQISVGSGAINFDGNFLPSVDSTYDVGTNSVRLLDSRGTNRYALQYYATAGNNAGFTGSFPVPGGVTVTATAGIVTAIV